MQEFAPGTTAARRIEREAVVTAGPGPSWSAWVIPEETTRFFGDEARIDLRPGGRYEILFDLEAPEGSRGSEECRILSYIPGEMLSFSWNAPPHLPDIRLLHTWVVVTFSGPPDGPTRVRLVHTGFGEGSDWDECVGYFERAWSSVLTAFGEVMGTP